MYVQNFVYNFLSKIFYTDNVKYTSMMNNSVYILYSNEKNKTL